MTVLGTITVKLSDDERYVAGQTYDVVLATVPDPAHLMTGTLDTPAPVAESASGAVTPDAPLGSQGA